MKIAFPRLLQNSTNVLFSEQIKPLRSFLLGVADLIAPASTADRLIALFGSPIRYPVPLAEADALKSGHAFTVTRDDGVSIPAWSWGDGPTVVLVHGWSGRGSQFYKFVQPFLREGFSVVLFDAPAHGHAAGTRTNMPDFAKTVRAVADETQAVGIVAHSFGAISTGLALARGMKPRAVVFLSSPADPKYYFDRFCARMGVSVAMKKRLSERISEKFNFQWQDLTVATYAGQMTAPLKIVQDPADKEVPWSHPLAIAKNWPRAELTPVRQVGHYRILRSPEVIEMAVDFVKKHLATEPGNNGTSNT